MRSAPGQGATFTFQFPAAEAPAAVGDERRTRVLICDDEAQILRALRVILGDAGFEVIPAMTVQEALDAAAVRRPEAAIIDLVLPDGDGVEVCRSIREWSEMPILVLSAVGDEREKVRALEAGADDYVTKPFGPAELVARLRAALRRVAPAADQEPVLSVGEVEIDLSARRVTRSGEEVHLTPTEFELLRLLVRNRGRLLTHRDPAQGRLGAGLPGRHTGAAGPHRQPAPKDRARAGQAEPDPDRSRRRLPLHRLAALHSFFIPRGESLRSLDASRGTLKRWI